MCNKIDVASAAGVTNSNEGEYKGSTEKITRATGATLSDALTDAVDPLETPPADKKKIQIKYSPSYGVYDVCWRRLVWDSSFRNLTHH